MNGVGTNQSEHSARSAVMEAAQGVAGASPVPALRSLVCPYCGTITPDSGRCSGCSGRFDPLSRQATQNQMGAWSIRDDRQPFRPGCTYQTIARLIEQRKISPDTVLRGPSTRQFWTLARHTPGISQLLGVCHSCQTAVKTDAFACPSCHASFTIERDRQHLGLGPSRPLPGQGLPEVLAMHAEPASQPGLAGGTIGLRFSCACRKRVCAAAEYIFTWWTATSPRSGSTRSEMESRLDERAKKGVGGHGILRIDRARRSRLCHYGGFEAIQHTK